MAVRRTSGNFSGTHSGPDAKRERLLAGLELVTDDETGEVSSEVKSDRRGQRATKMTRVSREAAKVLATIQEQLRSEEAAIAYASRPFTPIPKPKELKKQRKPVNPAPENDEVLMVQCPHCFGHPSANVICYVCDDDGWVPAGTKIAS